MHKRLVLLDDDADDISPILDQVKNAGFQIQRWYSVDDAMMKFEELRNVDLMVLDILLPFEQTDGSTEEYTGELVLQRMKRENVQTPVVVFSVVGAGRERKRLQQKYGIKYCFPKPTRPSELAAAVMDLTSGAS